MHVGGNWEVFSVGVSALVHIAGVDKEEGDGSGCGYVHEPVPELLQVCKTEADRGAGEMTSLKEFLKESKEVPSESNQGSPFSIAQRTQLMQTASKGISLAASAYFSGGNKAVEFAEKVAELATSDDVMDEVSYAIGMPKPDETEEEFVARAKEIMARVLNRKLLK